MNYLILDDNRNGILLQLNVTDFLIKILLQL